MSPRVRLPDVELELTLHWERKVYDRRTRELKRRDVAENSVPTAGKELFLDLMTGASAAHFDNASAILEFDLSSGSSSFEGASCDSGFPDHSTSQDVVFRWTDETSDSYTIGTIRMRQGSTTGTRFSEVSSPFADNSKTDTEFVEYTLTVSISDNSGTGELVGAGLDAALEMMTGDQGSEYDSGTGLDIEDGTGTVLASLGGNDSGFPSRTNQTVTYEWTAGSSTANVDWNTLVILKTLLDIGSTELRRHADTFGTKSSNEEWTFTWDFSV